MVYDLFYVSQGTAIQEHWQEFSSRFPSAQLVENVTDFSDLARRAFTKMFWVVWDDLQVVDEFDFAYRATKWDLEYVHVFKNGTHFNGICLFPKNTKLASKEFKFRFFINKKEIDILASVPRKIGSSFDIVFISYNEPNADKNWNILKTRFPKTQRISGVTGIHQAHIAAAEICSTDMFWVVDGDAVILDDFNFDFENPEPYTVYVWRSRNPINSLEYGYGGVKLLPREMTINMDLSKPDMTTGISNLFRPIHEVSNITEFNTDPFNTWKSAFRECCKLSSRVIDRQKNQETQSRLTTWCTTGKEQLYGKWAIKGAIAGKLYGEQHKDNIESLKKINDFNWLEQEFKKQYG